MPGPGVPAADQNEDHPWGADPRNPCRSLPRLDPVDLVGRGNWATNSYDKARARRKPFGSGRTCFRFISIARRDPWSSVSAAVQPDRPGLIRFVLVAGTFGDLDHDLYLHGPLVPLVSGVPLVTHCLHPSLKQESM